MLIKKHIFLNMPSCFETCFSKRQKKVQGVSSVIKDISSMENILLTDARFDVFTLPFIFLE